MKRTFLILLGLCCCLAVLWLTYRHFPEDRSGVPVTVKVINAGYVKPGYRVCLCRCTNGLVPDPTVVRDVVVLALDERESTITVDATPEQADKLARLDGCSPFMLGGDDVFDSPWWWKRFLRLRAFPGL